MLWYLYTLYYVYATTYYTYIILCSILKFFYDSLINSGSFKISNPNLYMNWTSF